MTRSMLSPIVSLALLIVLLAFGAAPAAAQSDQELRQENQRLKGEVQRLERELEAARDRITRLEEQIQRLREQLAGGGRGTGQPSEQPEEEKVSLDETQPEASPRALLTALRESYAEALSGRETGEEGSRERELYLRDLERWIARAAREYRLQVDWHVQILRQLGQNRTHYFVEMQAVDPKYGTELGDSFRASIAKARAGRVDDPNAVYRAKGTIQPRININPQREAAGAFDYPKLVGPFSEYNIILDVNSIVQSEIEEGAGDGGGNEARIDRPNTRGSGIRTGNSSGDGGS